MRPQDHLRNRLVNECDQALAPSFAISALAAAGARTLAPLIARITLDALHGLGLKVGQPVTALIKSASFDRLSLGAGSRDGSLVREMPPRRERPGRR